MAVGPSCPESKPCSNHRWSGFLKPDTLVLGGFIVGSLRSCWTLGRACPGQECTGDQRPSIRCPLGSESFAPSKGCLAPGQWGRQVGGSHAWEVPWAAASFSRTGVMVIRWMKARLCWDTGDISTAPAPALLCPVVVGRRVTPMYSNCMLVYNNVGV